MVTFQIGGTSYSFTSLRNNIGADYVYVADFNESEIATLGAPENNEIFIRAMVRGYWKWYRWENTEWVSFYPEIGPQGETGPTGATGPTGPQGIGLSPGIPASVSVSFATAYQAPDNTKSAFISVMIENIQTVVNGNVSDEVELRIGPTNAVATGGGNQIATTKTGSDGNLTTAGLVLTDRQQLTALIPPGWYFAVRHLSGSAATISATYVQPMT